MSNARPRPQISESVFETFRMKGKVVVVTGGSGGIGYQVVLAVAEAGADVALWYHSSKKAHQMAEDVTKKYGVRCIAYQCPVDDYEKVVSTMDKVVEDLGRLDAIVINAGIAATQGALDQSVESWRHIVDINFNAAFYCAKAAGQIFKRQNSGNIVFTASMSGSIVNYPQMQASYNAAKAGVIHLMRSLAVEFAEFNVRVNSVSPGYIDTGLSDFIPQDVQAMWNSFTPLCRAANPCELKGLYLYLLSDASTFTTGADHLIDGGYCAR